MGARWQIPLVSLGVAAMLQVGPSCTDGFESLNQVTTVRVLAAVADKPYAQPGEDVTLYLTYHDGRDFTPKPVEVTWIAGCVLPTGAPFAACYPQLEAAVQQIGETPSSGDDPKAGGLALIQQEVVPAELSGTPNGVSFNAPIPEDLFEIYAKLVGDEDEEVDSLVAYVFFTVCAGRVRPEAPDSEASFPLGCFDANGNRVGADGFVPGYTEVFIFEDDRPNENPPIEGLEIEGEPMGESPEEATVVQRCEQPEEDSGGCFGGGSEETRSEEELCPELEVEVIVGDVAEPDPQLTERTGTPHREVLWVDYYADAGGLEDEQILVSHALTGPRNKKETVWRPPEEPGIVTIWAVVHDNRGGASVKRGYLRVE